MEEIMLIEQIGSATFVNGLVRIQTLCAGPDGNLRESGVIEVPGNVAAGVINNLIGTLKELETKLAASETENKQSNPKGKTKGNGKSKGKSKS